MADMAEELAGAVEQPLLEAHALQRRVNFVGHSLGGSLALLLCAFTRLRCANLFALPL